MKKKIREIYDVEGIKITSDTLKNLIELDILLFGSIQKDTKKIIRQVKHGSWSLSPTLA